MTHSFLARPWLNANTSHGARVSQSTVLHADAYAIAGGYFTLALSAGGRKILSVSTWRYDNGVLIPCAHVTGVPAYWTRENGGIFGPAHHALIKTVQNSFKALGFNQYAFLAHYIPVLDATPWPRGFVNLYREQNVKTS